MSPGFCPGSKGMKEPTPENVKCPQCGYEVEIWTHELMRHCPQCNTPVMRPQKVSCIDWCSFAKECVGPQMYAKLKPSEDTSKDSGPIQSLTHQHDEAIKRLGVLKGATLCLRAGSRNSDTGVNQTLIKAIQNIGDFISFFNSELRDHFEKEEEGLFPPLEKHLAKEGSPVAQMLAEHQEMWQKIDEFKKAADSLPTGGNGVAPKVADDVERSASDIIRLLRAHIEKENTVLFPLVTATLSANELAEVKERWTSTEKIGATTKF